MSVGDLDPGGMRAEALIKAEVKVPEGAVVFGVGYGDMRLPMTVPADTKGVDRKDLSRTVKRLVAGEDWASQDLMRSGVRYEDRPKGELVGRVASYTQQALKDAGVTHVVLYRGLTEGDPFDRSSSTRVKSGLQSTEGVASGVTSWTAEPDVAGKYSGKYGKVVKAVVPIENILSFDLVGNIATGVHSRAPELADGTQMATINATGREVLVSADASVVARLVKGAVTASGVIELACHSKSCAPPPVGRGGSDGITMTTVNLPTERAQSMDDYRDRGQLLIKAEVKAPEGAGVFVQDKPVLTKVGEGREILIQVPERAGAIKRRDLSAVVKALNAGEDWQSVKMDGSVPEGGTSADAPSGRVVGEVAAITQKALRDAGVTHVVLYRGANNDDSNPFGRESSMLHDPQNPSTTAPSGVTSWSAVPSVASSFGARVVKAVIPVEHILSFDVVGALTTAKDRLPDGSLSISASGLEVLVARDASVVSRLVEGSGMTASGVIELACHSKECAPPPVGTGGSDRGSGIAMTVVDISDIGSSEKRMKKLEAAEVNVPKGGKAYAYEEDRRGPWPAGKIQMEVPARTVQIERTDLANTVRAARAGDDWQGLTFKQHGKSYGEDIPGSTVGEVASLTQAMLKKEGITHVVLYRGTSGEDGADPFDRMSSKYSEGIGTHLGPVSSGVTSWTTNPEVAADYGQKVVKAVVPVEHILSFDFVGLKSGGEPAGFDDYGYIGQKSKDPSEIVKMSVYGKEVLVSGDSEIVAKLSGASGVVASGIIELACHSKECAPPPVGRGGSDGGVAGGAVWRSINTAAAANPVAMLRSAEVEGVPEGAVVLAEEPLRVTVPSRIPYRIVVSKLAKGERPTYPERDEIGQVRDVVTATHDALRAKGVTHVVLYRGVGTEADPFGRESSSRLPEGNTGDPSGISSWTVNPNVAVEYGERVVKAVVPIDQIVSWDIVGYRSGAGDVGGRNMSLGGSEVLVAADPKIVEGLLASGALIELACHSKECAPPPVGKGGSSPSNRSGGAAYRVLNTVAAADPAVMVRSAVVPGVPEGAKVHDGGAVRVKVTDNWVGRGTISAATKGELGDRQERATAAIKEVVEASHEGLTSAGYTHVTLYRGVHSPDADPFARGSSMMQVENGPSSGVTSWTTDPDVALGYGPYVAKAVVPVGQIVSFDLVGSRKTPTGGLTPADGREPKAGSEVLVAADPKIVDAMLASGALCAACHSAACAPPPVGRGGSEPGHGITVRVLGPSDPLPAPTEFTPAYGGLLPKPGDLSPKAERALDSNRNEFTPAYPGDTVTDKWIMNRGMDRRDFVRVVTGPTGATGDAELTQFAVRSTQEALAEAGVKTVTLYRGVSSGRNADNGDPLREGVEGASGVTSWTAVPALARQFSSDGTIYVAEVPVSQILTWDNVGRQMTAMTNSTADTPAIGREVLVTTDPKAVERVLAGEFPATTRSVRAGEDDLENMLADGSLCAACYEKSCAPPPVGRGGSSGGDGRRLGGRVRGMIEELRSAQENGASADTLDDIRYRAETMFGARQQALAWEEMGGPSLGEDRQRVQDEFDALSEVLRPAEGFVRMGTPEAKAVLDKVRAVYPNAEVHQFADVHVGTVDKIVEAAAKFPPEVRAKIGRVALGFTEDRTHLAAVGSYPESRRQGINGNGGTILWLSERAVSPSVGSVTERLEARAAYNLVGPEERHGVVIAHEMAHIIHGMALVAEGRSAGTLETDSRVPNITTTKYGATNKAETVAEAFGLAKAKGFANITPEQRSLVIETLARAGLDAPADTMVGAAFAEDEFWDEFFIGDDFLTEGETAEMLEFACQSKECAPPPVGKGGSLPGGGSVESAVAAAKGAGLVRDEMFTDGSDTELTETHIKQMEALLAVGRAVDGEIDRRLAADPATAELAEQERQAKTKADALEADEQWMRSVQAAAVMEALAAEGIKLTDTTVVEPLGTWGLAGKMGRSRWNVVLYQEPDGSYVLDANSSQKREFVSKTIKVPGLPKGWQDLRRSTETALDDVMGIASSARRELAVHRDRVTADVLRGDQKSGTLAVKTGNESAAELVKRDLRESAALFPKNVTDRLSAVKVDVRDSEEIGTGGAYVSGSRSLLTGKTPPGGEPTIRVSLLSPQPVLTHELMHHVEAYIPDANRASWAFLKYRTRGEEPVRMADIQPSRGWHSSVLALPDKFTDAYSGRLYSDPDGQVASLSRRSGQREVGSMGAQSALHSGSSNEIDTEHRHFILGMLTMLRETS